jgi:hypothetical protein
VAGRRLTCEVLETDRYGRAVATCALGGTDVGQAMVQAGAATAYRRYSLRYAADEAAAQAAGQGIWDSRMVAPEAFRHPPAPEAAAGACAIKGNIGASGAIYHLPGQHDYDATRINPKKGEGWFCSEAEARAAGFRPARR